MVANKQTTGHPFEPSENIISLPGDKQAQVGVMHVQYTVTAESYIIWSYKSFDLV